MHFFGVKLGSVFDCGRKVRRSLTCAARLPTTLVTLEGLTYERTLLKRNHAIEQSCLYAVLPLNQTLETGAAAPYRMWPSIQG